MARASDIHREMVRAWNSRDFDQLKALCHAEYSFTGGDGNEVTGGPETRVSIAKMYASAFPDGTLEVKRVFTQGDTAIAEMVGRGTHGGEFMGVPPTHRRVEIPICNVIELRDGKVYSEHEYMDMLGVMTQLGVAVAGRKTRTGSPA